MILLLLITSFVQSTHSYFIPSFLGACQCPHFDIYFDRVVTLLYKNDSLATGVLIDKNRILSSFNPYRVLSRKKSNLKDMSAYIVKTKNYMNDMAFEYTTIYSRIKCARQVVPMVEKKMPDELWHGTSQTHSPIHDLMVFRIADDVKFLKTATKYKWNGKGKHTVGPLKTTIANVNDTIKGNLKVGGLGVRNYVWQYWNICSIEFANKDGLIVNCDEWFPRVWGHFICIDNREDWPALSSGMALANRDKVIGLGSFMLKKGKRSILVFTDVRPYFELINNTCTTTDQV